MTDIVARAKAALEEFPFPCPSPDLKLVAELVAEVERLRDVKSEWRMYCIRAESERDQLKAAVERVRDLSMRVAHDPDVEGMTLRDFGRIGHALAVLAALDGDDGKGEA